MRAETNQIRGDKFEVLPFTNLLETTQSSAEAGANFVLTHGTIIIQKKGKGCEISVDKIHY